MPEAEEADDRLLIPGSGFFIGSFALSEQVDCSARLFPEGRNVRLEVRQQRDLANVLRLEALKMGG